MVEGSGVAACGEDKLHRRRLFIRAIRTMELSRPIRVEMIPSSSELGVDLKRWIP